MKKYKYKKSFTLDGKRYYVYGDTIEDVAAKVALKKRDLERRALTSGGNMLVADWIDICIDTYKTNLRESTLKRFRYLVDRHITRVIGQMRIDSVKPLHCQEIMNAQRDKSVTQINEVMHALRFIFSHAVQNGMIETSPAAALVKPTAHKKEQRRALTAYEREHITRIGMSERRFYYFMLMLFCGCRPSESADAMGDDIQLIDGYNVLHIRGTKTAFSDRFVPIPDILYHQIKNTPSGEHIAVYNNGNIITPDNRSRLWRSFTRQVNLSMGCKTYRNALLPPLPLDDNLVPYCLRHEYCTDLARRGIDIRIAQKLMGHASVKMTANIYTNLELSDTIKIAELIGAYRGTTSGTTPL